MGGNATKMCDSAKIKCYIKNENKLYESASSHSSKNSAMKSFRNGCNCLPACTTIKYNLDISHLRLDPTIVYKSFCNMSPK